MHTNPFKTQAPSAPEPLTVLGLPTHLVATLTGAGVTSVQALTGRTELSLLELRGFGRGRLNAVKDALRARGLALGMSLGGRDVPSESCHALLKHIAAKRSELKANGFRSLVRLAETLADEVYSR